MAITVDLPREIEEQLGSEWGKEGVPRKALEPLAVEGYRSGALSAGQVAELLGLSVLETEAFLKERGAFLHYTLEDLEQDQQTHERLLGR